MNTVGKDIQPSVKIVLVIHMVNGKSQQKSKNHKSTFDLFLNYLKEHNINYYNELVKAGGYDNAYLGTENFKNTWGKISKDKNSKKYTRTLF